jgi:hypothetical protein
VALTSAAHARSALLTAIAFAALQERVFKCVRFVCRYGVAVAAAALTLQACRQEGFHYGGWVTFITSVSYCICAGLELLVTHKESRKGSLRVRQHTLALLSRGGLH